MVVKCLNQEPQILVNSADNGKHWLPLQLTGDKSNRDAIGTKIKVTAPYGQTLHNHVIVSVGFMSSSDRRVHYGLDKETSGASIEIRWPSGILQTLTDVPSDQFLKVEGPGNK